jgi:ribosomal protein S12 methylthiotransferase
VIVNTCGFIDAAKEESIGAVLDACDDARERGAQVAAVGCLVQRYADELRVELPEVDVFSGLDFEGVREALDTIAAGKRGDESAGRPAPRRPRPVHAYVKVSDGCDRRCAFCAIPLIKGDYETEAPAHILGVARDAVARGARELVLVGQDVSRWSVPAYGDVGRLLADLSGLGADWLRLLYLQPEGVSDALLEAVARHAVPYLDVPLQHASATVLRRMGRSGDGRAYLGLLESARAVLPGVAVRSTFIVGFPGETDEQFEELVDFVEEARFAVAGVFVFDPQEGTRAAAMPEQVPQEVKIGRAARLGEAIDRAARPFWTAHVGREADVLITEGARGGGRPAVGRIAVQAPDVDGVTTLPGASVRRGSLVRARVLDAAGFDLIAETV